MAKIMVQVPRGVGPLQVEFPEHKLDSRGRPVKEQPTDGKGAPARDARGRPLPPRPVPFGERSCDGALHLRPGSTKLMTAAELQHIKATRPDVGRRLRVVQEVKERPRSAPATPPKPPEALPPRVEPEPEPKIEEPPALASDKAPKGKTPKGK